MLETIQIVLDSLNPSKRPVIQFLFEPGDRPEESLNVKVEYLSLVPLLKAIGTQLRFLREVAFTEDGNIDRPDLVLDMHGLLQFLLSYFKTAINAKHPIKGESMDFLLNAMKEFAPYVEQAANMPEGICDICGSPFEERSSYAEKENVDMVC